MTGNAAPVQTSPSTADSESDGLDGPGWLMERRWPKMYGRKQIVRIEDTGSAREPMTLEQLIRWAERIESAGESCIGQLNQWVAYLAIGERPNLFG